jgi:hypothetical protein
MRSLVFQCPASNLVVFTGIDVDDVPADYLDGLPVEVRCPCGQRHVFFANEKLTMKRRVPSRRPGIGVPMTLRTDDREKSNYPSTI